MNTTVKRTSGWAVAWLSIVGVVLIGAGLFLAIGGGRLAMLGGSWYFLVAGIAIVMSGVLVILRRPSGAVLFGLITALTVVWAVWDAGFDFWPLVSRLAEGLEQLRQHAGRQPLRRARPDHARQRERPAGRLDLPYRRHPDQPDRQRRGRPGNAAADRRPRLFVHAA
jgi:hypothetical protein